MRKSLPFLVVLLLLACHRDSRAGAPVVTEVKCVDDHQESVVCGTVTLDLPAATAGAAASVKVALLPKGVFHVNKEFPISITVTPQPGVELAKPRLTAEDAAKLSTDGADFEVKFTAKDAGEKTFDAVFKFAVCTDKTCNPSIQKLSWKVAVK